MTITHRAAPIQIVGRMGRQPGGACAWRAERATVAAIIELEDGDRIAALDGDFERARA